MFLIQSLIDFLRQKTYRGLTISSLSIVLAGTVVYHFVEGWRWLDSFYFSVITLATVGYGDFSPQTDFGKIFTIFYILSGIGIIFGFINAFYQHSAVKHQEIREKRKSKFKVLKKKSGIRSK